jgi:N6-L-threonylcarbamoyladenine synthase
MVILGIETSCDETAISVVRTEGDLDSLNFELLGSAVHSQIDVHKEFGGVVPHLAKREHQKNLIPVLVKALRDANFLNSKFEIQNPKQIQNSNNENSKQDKIWNKSLSEILKPLSSKLDLIAVTVGPGLEPALWVGINFAKELGEKLNIPVVPTNHMEGHIASVLLSKTEANPKSELLNPKQNLNSKNQILNKKIEFPAIALLVSGGHTELVLLKSWVQKEKVGETLDDAVGEAFDKVARMISLPYPGGPEISKLAEMARNENLNLDTKFPRPMINSKDFNFSFSGLKTAVLYYIKSQKEITEQKKREIAREFEDAVIETLITKTNKAIEEYNPKNLIVGGGVIANKLLRQKINKLGDAHRDLKVLISEKNLATDNAVMIAIAGYIQFLTDKNKLELKANGNLNI